MVTKQMVLVYIIVVLLCGAPPGVPAQTDANPAFTERDAKRLLAQILDGLISHNPSRMLSAFDLARMNDGQLFRQNTNSFFRQTGTIRAHYNLLQTSVEDARGVADVAMEMEADQLNDNLPPLRKQAQLRFTFLPSAGGWKIVDLEPRTFFTTQP